MIPKEQKDDLFGLESKICELNRWAEIGFEMAVYDLEHSRLRGHGASEKAHRRVRDRVLRSSRERQGILRTSRRREVEAARFKPGRSLFQGLVIVIVLRFAALQ
jgi:hypothetical protein